MGYLFYHHKRLGGSVVVILGSAVLVAGRGSVGAC